MVSGIYMASVHSFVDDVLTNCGAWIGCYRLWVYSGINTHAAFRAGVLFIYLSVRDFSGRNKPVLGESAQHRKKEIPFSLCTTQNAVALFHTCHRIFILVYRQSVSALSVRAIQ
jgi:hypothetical protein